MMTSNDPRDQLNQSSRWMMNALSLILGAGALALCGLMWIRVEKKTVPPTVADYSAVSNAVRVAQFYSTQSNHRQRFIQEMFWHVGRFLTNDRVREISWNDHSISTYYDTNATYGNQWVMQITPTNTIARKEALLEKQD
jgi:hypothetical protein